MSAILSVLQAEIGKTHRSDWLLVDQSMIDRFAAVTLDEQFIHVDPERAAASPFGGTIAHGFLTLSLLSYLAGTAPGPDLPEVRMGVNYGFDQIRFVSPVRSGSRIRALITLSSINEKRPGQYQRASDVVVEIEGLAKPALTAIWLSQLFT